MADESLPPSRVVRWMVLGGVIVACVGFYFRWGRDVPPVGSAAAPLPAVTEVTR